MTAACAALLASFLPGLVLADLDRSKVYEIPAAIAAHMTTAEMLVAKACARRHGLRWRIAKGGT